MTGKKINKQAGILLAISTAIFVTIVHFLPDMSLLTKCFIVFCGMLIARQCIPAALSFVGLVKSNLFAAGTKAKQMTLR